MSNFAIIGVGGYIAPRHLKAIRETGNSLVAALDVNDSVGVLDRYFPEVPFFTEFERFDRFAEKLKRQCPHERIEYVSICSPNYLHDAHIRFALRIGAHAICEKPLVINPWNLDVLQELERESLCRVHTILQLRVHPQVQALRDTLTAKISSEKSDVILTYVTSRGPWYHTSWKGNMERSGGAATNIGIHLFDLLIWLFGDVVSSDVHEANSHRTGGFLELERARVRWFLSLDRDDLPADSVEKGYTTFRSIVVDGKELEFSDGFADLHTVVYQETLAGRGFGIKDARPSINLAHQIRNASPQWDANNCHEFLRNKKESING